MPPRTLRELITLHEGRVPHAYQDSLGYWTIGVGHLIDKRKGGRLPEKIIDLLLDHDIQEHTNILLTHQPWVTQLDSARFAVLTDMAFNLGPEPFNNNGVKDWPMFLAAVKSGRYAEAADIMLKTKWATQVGGRADRLAKMMRSGQWPT